MQRQDFDYYLPPEQIAQFPLDERTDSRLLGLTHSGVSDDLIADFQKFLKPGDVLVFNDTQVVPARLKGCKESGGKVEIMLERVLDDQQFLAQVKASKSPKTDSVLLVGQDQTIKVRVLGREKEFFKLVIEGSQSVFQVLHEFGDIPLPPYIHRPVEDMDAERYQTVYASEPGAVAAPTAGLHFSQRLLQELEDFGVLQAFVTLHVGAGTFKPMRVDDIQQHVMHAERVIVSESSCRVINQAKAQGKRVIAVGTTSVRCLESAWKIDHLAPIDEETRLFITPGYEFRCVDALLTNFHLPQSTLLMLVCALGGYQRVMNAYRQAVSSGYRFFSYGDAMWVTKP
jgi:S-adenosylmethionine:tRNA ribosyltransferase-isomerase